jgi:hypothetical protein
MTKELLTQAIQEGKLYAKDAIEDSAYIYYEPNGIEHEHAAHYIKSEGCWIECTLIYGDLVEAIGGPEMEPVMLELLGLHHDPPVPPPLPISVIRRPKPPAFTRPEDPPAEDLIVTNPTYTIPQKSKRIEYPAWIWLLLPVWAGSGIMILYHATQGSYSMFTYIGVFWVVSMVMLTGVQEARKKHQQTHSS